MGRYICNIQVCSIHYVFGAQIVYLIYYQKVEKRPKMIQISFYIIEVKCEKKV